MKNILSKNYNITPHFTGESKIMSLSSTNITSRLQNITLCFSIIILCLLSITFLTGNIFGISLSSNNTNNASALTYSSTTDVSFTFSPKLSISLSDTNLVIDTLVPGQTSTSNAITITVASNTPYGYSLYADTGSNNTSSPYYNTSSLIHEDNTINNTFTSIATNASLTSLTTDNTWGYSTSTNNGTTWSTYNGLLPTTSTESSTSTSNPSLLIDTKDPADSSRSIAFKVAARASTTQASGTYGNVINFYAVGKPRPNYLYDEVAKMNKGTQTVAQLRANITEPTSTNYLEDTSNSGVYEYDESAFGKSSDASNTYKIYYYRGILEPESDRVYEGSTGEATTYPNYVRFDNDTCWRIIRTTGSGGVKMLYSGMWTGSTCANSSHNTEIGTSTFNGDSSSYRQIVRVGYTYDSTYANSNSFGKTLATLLGTNASDNNTTDSEIKSAVDDWYSNNLTAYTNLLEPSAGYCNDRTIYNQLESFEIPQTSTNNTTYYFGAYRRNPQPNSAMSMQPSLTCAKYSNNTITVDRSKVDLYSVSGASTGNGELTYPIALLTADEVNFSGGGVSNPSANVTSSRSKSFMVSGSDYWLLSPYSYSYYYGWSASEFNVFWDGSFSSKITGYSSGSGIRPVISLKSNIAAASGSGTATDPWFINE